jgi:hypothetical protein
MTGAPSEDPRLIRLTEICLAFPEATREDHGRHATFRVRKKAFVYYLDDHHGDGIVAACFKVGLGENKDLAELDPSRFYPPAYIGPSGWVGLRLDLGEIDWEEVAEYALGSYCHYAPKKLAAVVESGV